MNALLLCITTSAAVLQNSLSNTFSKKFVKEKGDIYNYNFYTHFVCFILFLILALREQISLFTILLSIAFGFVTFLSFIFKQKALVLGPMHLTNLVITSSMVIPALSGAVFFGEKFSIYKGIAILILIYFIFLSLKKTDNNQKSSKKWLIYCAITFVAVGIIGVLQKVHQTSIHKDELSSFLAISFFMSMTFASIMRKKAHCSAKIDKTSLLMAITGGICTFANNYINLKLSGIIPSQLFFPLVNGSAIILTSLVSCFVFNEKLTKRQTIGLIGGILSLILICLV